MAKGNRIKGHYNDRTATVPGQAAEEAALDDFLIAVLDGADDSALAEVDDSEWRAQERDKLIKGLTYIGKLTGGKFNYASNPGPRGSEIISTSADDSIKIKAAAGSTPALKNAGERSGLGHFLTAAKDGFLGTYGIRDSVDLILGHIAENVGLQYGLSKATSQVPATSPSEKKIQKQFMAGVQKKAAADQRPSNPHRGGPN